MSLANFRNWHTAVLRPSRFTAKKRSSVHALEIFIPQPERLHWIASMSASSSLFAPVSDEVVFQRLRHFLLTHFARYFLPRITIECREVRVAFH